MHFLQITDFHSPAVLTPSAITHVIDRRDGTSSVVTARDVLFKLDAEGLALLRRSDHCHRQDGSPQFLCAFCGDPLHVRVRSVAASGRVDGRRAAVQSGVPEAITTLATLLTGRKADTSGFPDEAVSAIVNNLLRPDLSGQNSNLANRSWAFAIAQIEDADPQVRQPIDPPKTKTRARLNAALAERAADPALSQRLRCTWSPLLERLFPRLKS